ncbi:hypothetical protein K8R66_01605 [bacterium]|nr:hypothetical protein [bacterium]
MVYNLKLAPSRNTAKQLINHGHFKINGRLVNIPSYKLKIGDKVEVKESKIAENYWISKKEALKNEKNIPTWLSLDSNKLTAQVTGDPNLDDIQKNIDTSLIVEFYSR